MDFKYSNYGLKSFVPSAVNQLTAEFALDFREGVDINLGVGYVNDQTIPANYIRDAYANVISNPVKYRNALNYGGAEGSPNLINSIKEYHVNNSIGSLADDDFKNRKIIIGANGATSLLDAISDVFEPGIIITADPFYYIFTETLERKGYKLLAIEEDQKGIRTDKMLEATETINPDDISFFYVVTVNNPSTSILDNNRKREIVEIANALSKKRQKLIPVIFDKAYEDIIHNTSVDLPVSGMKYDTLGNVIEIGTLSKVIAPALRIGYMFCPQGQFADCITQRISDIGFSNSLINQEISSWLIDNILLKQRKSVNSGYQKKAVQIKDELQKELGEYLEYISGGDAAFYFYLTFKNIRTDKESAFFKFLSRTTSDPDIDGASEKKPRLIYIPGIVCSKGEKAKFQLRLSYGFEDVTVFKRAINLMKLACEYAIGKS